MRTLSLLLVLLLHCASAFAEARFSFATTPGKLPKDVVPKHYTLRIEPAPGNERFSGRADIDIEVAKPVDSVTLNASELTIAAARLISNSQTRNLRAKADPARETVTLTPAAGTIAAGRYRLSVDYTGRIGRHPEGFYRIDYRVNEGGQLVGKVMLATQMEPVAARKLFPGWDEPVFRATFELTAVVDKELTAVSNMPVASQSLHGKNQKEVKFRRSVPMPTYLVALFIGELEAVHDNVDGIALGFYAPKGGAATARYAMEATREVVHYYNEYFGRPYALPKLDQIALPGGIGGAMENWGAIAYNEARLLVDPAEGRLRQRQGAYAIIAHEIAHQWFGNLVTMAWWDNLWLNEGFAQWMQTKAAERFHPEWGMRLRAGLFRESAMTDDARRTTHPIQTPVENDARAMDVFDSITYGKGAAFIGMLESYLGEAAFRDGIRRHMKAHAFSNATTADLWHHLSSASGRDVAALAAPWTEQPGFPVVRVENRCENGAALVRLTQERFTLNDPAAEKLLWRVPVMLRDAKGVQTSVLLEGEPREVKVGQCGPVIANAGRVGYFRVEYDAGSFKDLARSLPGLPLDERFGLLTDAFALVQAGRLPADRYLGLVDRLGDERDTTVWEHVLSALGFLRALLDAPEARAAFDRKIVHLLRPVFAQVGWNAVPGEGADVPALRATLISALGRAGDTQVVAEARARFAARKESPIDPSLRPAVLSTVARHADAAAYEALFAEMRGATRVEQRWQFQGALRQLGDPVLARRWMEYALKTNDLAPGDAVFNVQRTGADSGHHALAWDFVRENLAAILRKASVRGRTYVLPEAAVPFADEKVADELLALTRERLDAGAYYQAEKTADWIRLKAGIKGRESARIAIWAGAQ